MMSRELYAAFALASFLMFAFLRRVYLDNEVMIGNSSWQYQTMWYLLLGTFGFLMVASSIGVLRGWWRGK